MAEKIPIKVRRDIGGNTTALEEFSTTDTIPVDMVDGGKSFWLVYGQDGNICEREELLWDNGTSLETITDA